MIVELRMSDGEVTGVSERHEGYEDRERVVGDHTVWTVALATSQTHRPP